jgi:hypothetical protein
MPDVPLREYCETLVGELDRRTGQRFDQNDRALEAALLSAKEAVAAALTAAKEAVDKAELAASKRFEATNEFREQLSDQAATFMPREVADQQFAQVNERLSGLTQRIDTGEGRSAGVSSTVGYLLAVATLVISVVVLLANGVL